VIHPYLGLQLVPLTARRARRNKQGPEMRVAAIAETGEWRLVASVVAPRQAAAELAGLRRWRSCRFRRRSTGERPMPACCGKRLKSHEVGEVLPLKWCAVSQGTAALTVLRPCPLRHERDRLWFATVTALSNLPW